MTDFTGTGTLIRFILRRDRLRIPVWIIGIVGFFVLVAASFPGIYPSAEERQARAELMDNPTAQAFRGPGHGLEDYTYGAMLANELMGYATIAVALMSIFLTVRHTRVEEESGRLELVRAAVVGRYASPTAALLVVGGANILIGVLFAVLLPGLTGEYPFAGSLAFGMAIASVGLVFTAVAGVTVQLTEFSRGASSMAALALGIAFLLRAIGDVQQGFLSWLSPIGWAQSTQAYVDEQWWPLAISLGFAALLVVVAFTLINQRDVAAGLLPQTPGPATASNMLGYPVGFAFRRQRGAVIGWSSGLAVLGVAFGSLGGEVEEFLADSPQLEEFIQAAEGVTLLESFLGLIMLIMALLATGFGIQSALHARAEETEGRAEPLLSTALARRTWLGSYLIVAMLGGFTVLLSGGLGLGVTVAIDQNDISLLTGVLGAVLVYVPVMWLVIGLVSALFGFAPRAAGLPWLVLVYGFFVGLFGEMVQIPGWMFDLSPYEHVPELPGGDVSALPIVALAAAAAVLLIAGLAGFQKRDLHTV